VAARGGGGQHFVLREEQIEQFAYLTRGGEVAVGDEQLRYKFKDAHNPTTAAAAAVDGNKDDGKNDSKDDNNRQTSSARSNLIVRILFLTLLLLAYCKLY
jgi:hypothetical protein